MRIALVAASGEPLEPLEAALRGAGHTPVRIDVRAPDAEVGAVAATVFHDDPGVPIDDVARQCAALALRSPLLVVTARCASDELSRLVDIAGDVLPCSAPPALVRLRAERMAEHARRAPSPDAFQDLPLAFVGSDANGRIIEWNAEAERISGYARDEIVNNPRALELLYDEQERAKIARDMRSGRIGSGNVRDLRYLVRRKDGELRSVSWSSFYRKQPIPEVASWVVGLDVSEAELEAERYRTLARSMPNGLVTLFDRDLRLLLVDGQGAPSPALQPDRLVGQHVSELAAPEDRDRVVEAHQAALAGQTSTIELQHQAATFELTTLPVFDRRGHASCGMGLLLDITSRKRAEAGLRASERRLKTIFEKMPVMFCAMDADRVIVEWNHEAERVTGYSRAEVVGTPSASMLMQPDAAERDRTVAFLETPGGDFRDARFRVRAKDGSLRTLSWSSIARQVPIEGWATWAVGVDVTERENAERATILQRERLHQILSHSPAMVLGLRLDGTATFANPATQRVSGYSEDEIIGRNWLDLAYPGDERVQVTRMFDCMDERGGIKNHEMTLTTKTGQKRTVLWNTEPQPTPHGDSFEVFCFGLDITERNEMQARLQIAERMASVGTLAAGVAHEINNPLTCVTANLDLITERLAEQDTAALADLAELVADTREGADRVRKVVRDLRTLSRADEERMEAVDVQRCLEASLQMATHELRHRARVVRDLRPTGRVMANEARLGQVFLNLLINAAQAMPEGHGRDSLVRVVSYSDGAGSVVVEVADNGTGIAPEHLVRIFDPFFTTKPIGVGTGLGLAIAHRIVAGFGGDLTVESELGRGSVFRVRLPETPQASVPLAPRPEPPPATRRARILVVDDEELVGMVIRRALDRHHDVTVLQRADEALALLDDGQRFDCILCDLMMPEMSGIELHARLRQRLPDAAERMVFMTGAVTPSVRDFFQSVQNEQVEKPFEIHALVALVNEKIRSAAPVA